MKSQFKQTSKRINEEVNHVLKQIDEEQIDLFIHWQRRGSLDASFLGGLALVASGFYWRQPEILQKAKKQIFDVVQSK